MTAPRPEPGGSRRQGRTRCGGEFDPDARLKIADKIDKVLAAYVPIVPMAPLPNVYAVKSGLVNYGAKQFQSVDWTVVGWAK